MDLRATVDHCISLAAGDLEARSIAIANSVGNVPPVFADRKDVVKIALSILANSVDAIGKAGSISVSSRTSQGRSGAGQVGLIFEDTGPGVAAADVGKVFDAFYTTKRGGSGLGLFSAKKRARANGGDILCEMGEQGKSRFVVILPVAGA